MRSLNANVKWVRPESMHLTLRFLGNIEPEAVSDLDEVIHKVGQQTQACDIEVAGLGVFPNMKRARVIWAGIRSAGRNAGFKPALLPATLSRFFNPWARIKGMCP